MPTRLHPVACAAGTAPPGWSCSRPRRARRGAVIAAGLIWFERRLLGFFQDRCGPNRVGPAGLLQVLADTVKIFTKEDWIPPFADRRVFVLAPAIILVIGAALVRRRAGRRGVVVADLNVGLLFFLACRRWASTAWCSPAGRRTASTR